MPVLEEALQTIHEGAVVGTIGTHNVQIAYAGSEIWEAVAWSDSGDAPISVQGPTLDQVRQTLRERLSARI
jgi:hypothetical protein